MWICAGKCCNGSVFITAEQRLHSIMAFSASHSTSEGAVGAQRVLSRHSQDS